MTIPTSITASVFIATSLDGFIARDDGAIDWLEAANQRVPHPEDCGYGAFFDSVDALVMGRNTYELVSSYEVWPYANKRVVVLSSRELIIPLDRIDTVSTSSKSPQVLVDQLATEGATHLYIDGGVTIQSFLRAGLIDKLTITVIPVLLGSGKSLFGTLDQDILLEHLSTTAYDWGFVQSTYRVCRDR